MFSAREQPREQPVEVTGILVVVKKHAPASQRNRVPIADVLEGVLPNEGTVLEISSGSGEHAMYFAARFPHLIWQPSDVDPDALESIRAWADEASLKNLREPLALNVTDDSWPIAAAAAVLNMNMIHISPWETCVGLMKGAGRLLAPGKLLYIYGPMIIDGRETAPSNVRFDESLRTRNPSWGIRHLSAVEAQASANDFQLTKTVDMPANNVSLIFTKNG